MVEIEEEPAIQVSAKAGPSVPVCSGIERGGSEPAFTSSVALRMFAEYSVGFEIVALSFPATGSNRIG
jgi:hypothetical protein